MSVRSSCLFYYKTWIKNLDIFIEFAEVFNEGLF